MVIASPVSPVSRASAGSELAAPLDLAQVAERQCVLAVESAAFPVEAQDALLAVLLEQAGLPAEAAQNGRARRLEEAGGPPRGPVQSVLPEETGRVGVLAVPPAEVAAQPGGSVAEASAAQDMRAQRLEGTSAWVGQGFGCLAGSAR
jgi:hypothetical protein